MIKSVINNKSQAVADVQQSNFFSRDAAQDAAAAFVASRPVPVVQRKCEHCEQEEKKLQRKEDGTDTGSELEQYTSSISGSGEPLPQNVRGFYEPRFGYDFSNVRVHTDNAAAGSARSVNALAYTAGNHIVFNSGQYAPGTHSGKQLLAHELTHVIQQAGTNIPANNIQRAIGDGHDLRSENFSGDPELEACYDGDNAYYLRYGNRGETVQKVQEGLIQVGYTLPQYGADGIFKEETDGTVRHFQQDYQLGADGIVGPITIGKLDELLPQRKTNPEPPSPSNPLEIPPSPVCQVPDEQADTVIQAKHVPSHQRNTIRNVSVTPVVQCKHLTMRESMDEYAKKINSSVSTDPDVTAKGQFYWSQLALKMIIDDINKTYTMLDPIVSKVGNLMIAIMNDDTVTINKLMLEIPKDIEKSGVSNAPDLLKIFLPMTNVEHPTTLWSRFNKDNHVPSDFSKYKNFSAYKQLRDNEKTACWSMAQFAIKRFEDKGGYTDIDASKKGKTKPSFSAAFIQSATRYYDWSGSTLRGDVVSYNSNLAGNITKMKGILDDGFLLHARVVSGVNFGTGLHPTLKASKGVSPVPPSTQVTGQAEHSLVIIGYEDTSDEFIFWDPDSSVSSYQGKQGFGILHYNNNSFTTAKDAADMYVNEDGQHTGGSSNKRYQVLSVAL
ncbi:MAG: DUF4157 domain-containing protein [Chitinophagaceae bacterium]